mmetsp:Transcript_7982/g.7178  ORF Transcript_7982/g.7178 Transcript_7982/m.7178 type:complete len:146 (+) Transcript_7982:206-643(+)
MGHVLTIGVKFTQMMKMLEDPNHRPTFTILASSMITRILPNHQYFGAVAKDNYAYYEFNVYDKNSTIEITLTSFKSSDPDLYVTKGLFARPTKERSQFSSELTVESESLTIRPNDLYPKSDMDGTWVIAVYGKKEGSYSLTVSTG